MLKSTFCILVLVNALIFNVSGQSRGESLQRQYYSTSSQQQYANVQPQYNAQQQQPQKVNYQYQQQNVQRPASNNYNQPAARPSSSNTYYSPQPQQLNVRPINNNNNYYQQPQGQTYQNSQQNPSLDSRFSDDPNAYNSNDFSTRRPPPQGLTLQKPQKPVALPPKFDDINNRKLVWDPELTQNAERFALTLFTLLAAEETENFMISPQSIHNLLVLIAEGASGKTYAELNNALGLINQQRTRDFHQYSNLALNKSAADVSLRQFSAMLGDVNRPVGREYEDIVEKIYNADYIPVNFQDIEGTLRTVNDLVSKNTNGLIREAVTRDELLKAQLILLSGINFQGRWKSVFNTSFTKTEPFKDFEDNRVIGNVKMMFQRGPFPFAAIRELGSYFIELPYGTNGDLASRNGDIPSINEDRISMILVLPRKGLPLSEAANNIYTHGMSKVLLELKKAKEEYEDDEVEVHVPRFEIDTSINLVDTLKDMGITSLFDQTSANLEKINNNYFVSSVLHKTKIRVDEKGTEAAGVTTSIFANKATPPKFHANRPFLYFIVDKSTRLILFAGAYQKPELY